MIEIKQPHVPTLWAGSVVSQGSKKSPLPQIPTCINLNHKKAVRNNVLVTAGFGECKKRLHLYI